MAHRVSSCSWPVLPLVVEAAEIMHCHYFRCTMRSDLCLEYQARARGTAKRNNGTPPPPAIIGVWKIRYKPCLNCQQGQDIAANGGKDEDVELLKNKAATKYCRYCQKDRPLDDFYQSNGKYLPECKECASARHMRRAAEKKAAQFIDHNAPNIASKVDIDAIETQSISENVNDINHKDIDSTMLNADQNVNITSNFPAPVSDAQGKVVAWDDQVFVCRKCGRYYTPAAWATLEYVDDLTRVCCANDCRGIVSMLVAEITPGGGKIDLEEKPMLRTCTRCGWTGPEKNFHLAGNNGHIDVCRQCVVKQRKANAKAKAENTVELGLDQIVLDFSEYPEILEKLKADAKRNFRNINNEVLYRLVNHEKS